ncbi:MAG: ammonia channel protein, partial [Acidobacteria bacterium]|nr:ammonia channel protein [Acidobacteriota bacterium]
MKMSCMRRAYVGILLLLVVLGFSTPLRSQGAASSDTPASAPAPNTPTASARAVDEAVLNRIADLEAYINNTGAKALVDVPGPGHNAFMMICAALVLFMTLPGLALFYGGLVRTKNVLSVLAQCLGTAG